MNSAPLSSANDIRDAAYHRNQVKSLCFLALLAVVLVAAALLSLRAGSYETPLAELVRGVFGLAQDEKINLVVQANRLPRICTAILGGAGLGLAGCILQAILTNPLASASTLGVSQGAAFGAAFAIVTLGLGGKSGAGITLCSFAGSLAVAAVILGVSGVSAGGGPNALPDGQTLDTPVFHGPWIVSSFVLAAAAALLLIDAAVRARRRRTDRFATR